MWDSKSLTGNTGPAVASSPAAGGQFAMSRMGEPHVELLTQIRDLLKEQGAKSQ